MKKHADNGGNGLEETRFRVRLAGLTVDILALHQDVWHLCKDYLEKCDDAVAADLAVSMSQEAIDAERAIATEGRHWADSYLETLAVLRNIANELPQRNRMLVHGAVIQYAGKAYLFMAPSGTGKSTHIMLWQQYLGVGVRVVNGDKPFVHIPAAADESPIAYGTPWAGKEGWQENVSAPPGGYRADLAQRRGSFVYLPYRTSCVFGQGGTSGLPAWRRLCGGEHA